MQGRTRGLLEVVPLFGNQPLPNLEDEGELHDMLRYAAEVTAENTDTLVRVLDGLESTIVERSHSQVDTTRVPRIAFRRLILWYDLFHYVSAKLSHNSSHFNIFDTGALFVASQVPRSYSSCNSLCPSSSRRRPERQHDAQG